MRQILLLVFVFCITSPLFAQFNTIKPTAQKETWVIVTDTIPQAKKDSVPKKSKLNWFKRLFTSKSRKDKLKEKLDSIKAIVKEQDKVQKEVFNELLKELRATKKAIKVDTIKVYPKYPVNIKASLPLDDFHINSNFGLRKDPFHKQTKMHNGLDLKANQDKVYAVLSGTIKEVGFDKNGAGRYIKISHNKNYETIYCHLSRTYYKEGDIVMGGYVIGKSGNTGRSTAPHLHFAVKENGTYIDPQQFLKEILEISNTLNLNHYGIR